MRRVLNLLTILGISSTLYGVEVGDKIKFVMPTIMCENKVQMQPIYQLQMVMSDDLGSFQKKFNSKKPDGCSVANTGRSQNIIGTVVAKQKDFIPKKMTGAKIDLVYEYLKIEFNSIGGKDVSGAGASWFTSFDAGPIYEIIK